MNITAEGSELIRVKQIRTKGWKMPPQTKFVGRPRKWGSMFKLDNYNRVFINSEGRRQATEEWIFFCNTTELEGPKLLLDLYHLILIADSITIQMKFHLDPKAMLDVRYWIKKFQDNNDLNDLKGFNLACCCELDYQYCHADLLLYLANK